MHNVENPIVIDQNYCPHNENCPGQESGIKISDVVYQNIRGTSATKIAVKFDCSSRHPCKGIRLENVDLTYQNEAAQSSCDNALGKAYGFVEPNSCLILLSSLFIFAVFQPSSASTAYNVMSFGAKPNGVTDSTQPFLNAWAAACASVDAPTIYVPKGRYLLQSAVFSGNCRSSDIRIQINGTLVAPMDYQVLGKANNWLSFEGVSGVSVYGGALDARGPSLWACKAAGLSRNIAIMDSSIKTGDDCVSIGPGTKNLWIERVSCGPGHGISIGSLAKDMEEEGVQNVTVKKTVFTGSTNGLRIKSWARPSEGFVQGIRFLGAVMRNVQNPIVIDQNYCPHNENCPGQVSGIKISDVLYRNIRGTSATEIAIKFDCSSKNPVYRDKTRKCKSHLPKSRRSIIVCQCNWKHLWLG
ncbi:hypothetical protein L1049_021144 [Liquidambar formosana]|uniref:Polygalacturonase n=1 Tax=Liquidambar formosana TaxID=63359 RepID=A0AAP0SA76_LIQFO